MFPLLSVCSASNLAASCSAATDAKDAKFAAWKMRHELLQVGAKYPALRVKDVLNGVVKNQTSPESFDYGLQTMLNTGTLPKKLWGNHPRPFPQ